MKDFNGMRMVLNRFERATGLQVNFDKSYVLFSPNTSDECKKQCMDILGVQKS